MIFEIANDAQAWGVLLQCKDCPQTDVEFHLSESIDESDEIPIALFECTVCTKTCTQYFGGDTLTDCPRCHGNLRKVVSAKPTRRSVE